MIALLSFLFYLILNLLVNFSLLHCLLPSSLSPAVCNATSGTPRLRSGSVVLLQMLPRNFVELIWADTSQSQGEWSIMGALQGLWVAPIIRHPVGAGTETVL